MPTACESCSHPLAAGELVCRNCGALVYHRELNQLAGEAMRLEAANPAAAAMVWRRMLDLLPPDSAQYQQIYQRLGALAAGWSPAASGAAEGQQAPRPVRPPDPLGVALMKTVGSMLASIVLYYFVYFRSWPLAIAFVVLMLIHEMGHVLAMRYYGLSASPPIFIPFIGALINLRQAPPNALVEAVVGIGGPLLGTIGAVACYLVSIRMTGQLELALKYASFLGLFLNLFNLLPVPPLDGGRVTAAISPWLWIVGLVGLGLLLVQDLWASGGGIGVFILLMILFYALPRVRMTLRARGTHHPYYQISRRASWTMAALYIGLTVFLSGFMYWTGALGKVFLKS